jgi:hypothetical protein
VEESPGSVEPKTMVKIPNPGKYCTGLFTFWDPEKTTECRWYEHVQKKSAPKLHTIPSGLHQAWSTVRMHLDYRRKPRPVGNRAEQNSSTLVRMQFCRMQFSFMCL